MSRYETLLHLIHVFRPQHIVEVGTWNGDNAIRMIKTAQAYHSNISYTGFDLFEHATAESDARELNVKAHNTRDAVLHKIKAYTNADVTLIAGDTRETLRVTGVNQAWNAIPEGEGIQPRWDFAFIDGGHSVETIESDYQALRWVNTVVLDDFYVNDEAGRIPDISKYGCNKLVGGLQNATVLPQKDPVKGGGYTQLVMVL